MTQPSSLLALLDELTEQVKKQAEIIRKQQMEIELLKGDRD